jgi:hypothetical protein
VAGAGAQPAVAGKPPGLAALDKVITREPRAWVLALFYFLTFGGFVAFAIYLPTLCATSSALTADAGLRAAGFVSLATRRPLGGGSPTARRRRVLAGVFLGVVPSRCCSAGRRWCPSPSARSAARRCSASATAPSSSWWRVFADRAGIVAGLVGAMGGLGGFFPPLLLGFFRDRWASSWPASCCSPRPSRSLVARPPHLPARRGARAASCRRARRAADRVRAGACATSGRRCWSPPSSSARATCSTSTPRWCLHLRGRLRHLGVVYHYAVWIQKPPTRIYWRAASADAASAACCARRLPARTPGRTSSRRPSSPALAAALVDAPAALLGLPAGGRHHLPAGVRLGPLQTPRRGDQLTYVATSSASRGSFRSEHALAW